MTTTDHDHDHHHDHHAAAARAATCCCPTTSPAVASTSQNDVQLQRLHAGQGVRLRPGHPLGDQLDHRLGRPGLDLRRPRRDRQHPAGSSCSGIRPTPPPTRSRSRPTPAPGRPSTGPPPAAGFKETINVNGTGRYVRMYGTARVHGYGYSLWEFQVYGTGGSPVQPPAAAERDLPGQPAGLQRRVQRRRPAPGRTRPSGSPTPAGREQRAAVLHEQQQRPTDGAGSLVMEARREVDRRVELPGRSVPVHLGPDQHLAHLHLHLRAGRGPHQGDRHAGSLAGVLDARGELPAGELAGLRRDRHHGARRHASPTRPTPPCTRPPTSGRRVRCAVHRSRATSSTGVPHLRGRVGPAPT